VVAIVSHQQCVFLKKVPVISSPQKKKKGKREESLSGAPMRWGSGEKRLEITCRILDQKEGRGTIFFAGKRGEIPPNSQGEVPWQIALRCILGKNRLLVEAWKEGKSLFELHHRERRQRLSEMILAFFVGRRKDLHLCILGGGEGGINNVPLRVEKKKKKKKREEVVERIFPRIG